VEPRLISVYILYKASGRLDSLLDVLKEVREADVIGEATNTEMAMSQITDKVPDMVLVEIGKGLEDHVSFIERMRGIVPRTSFYAFGSDLDSDTVIRAVNAGAKYFIKEPFNLSMIGNLIQRSWSERQQGLDEKSTDGKVLTVFSNKGGLGKTTVATNLAVSLALTCRKSVALVDLDLQFGDVSIFLDLHPSFTITDLVTRIKELDSELIYSSLIRHETGVHALTEPRMAEESDLITPDHINKIINMMKGLFDFVVVDTTHSFDDVIIEALEISDSILLISVLDLPTIRNTQRCLEIFSRLNFPEEKIKIIVNRFMSEEEVDPGRFESALKFPVYWKIPNDYSTVINAINGGVPIHRLAPSSAIARNFNELAWSLSGSADGKRSNQRSGHIIKKVFSLMSRSKGE
jgi:pilus assembly protein CpaE